MSPGSRTSNICAAVRRPGFYAGPQGDRSLFKWRRDAVREILDETVFRVELK